MVSASPAGRGQTPCFSLENTAINLSLSDDLKRFRRQKEKKKKKSVCPQLRFVPSQPEPPSRLPAGPCQRFLPALRGWASVQQRQFGAGRKESTSVSSLGSNKLWVCQEASERRQAAPCCGCCCGRSVFVAAEAPWLGWLRGNSSPASSSRVCARAGTVRHLVLRSSLFGLLSALQFPDAPQLLQAAVAGKNKILCTLFLKTNEAYRSGNGITAVGRGGGSGQTPHCRRWK